MRRNGRQRPTAAAARPRAPKRRRRKPEEAELEILQAAERFLRNRPFRDLTVDEVMARTTLSRSSFYEYFRDRHALVLKMVERLESEFSPRVDRWFRGTDDPIEDLREAYDGVASVYTEHGSVLRALFDAASHDRDVEKAYSGLIQRFIDATAARIRVEMRAGRIRGLDPDATAAALIWMSERFMTERVARARGGKPQAAAEVLIEIWTRVLYGRRR